MKKLTLLLAIALFLILTGCNNDNATDNQTGMNTDTTDTEFSPNDNNPYNNVSYRNPSNNGNVVDYNNVGTNQGTNRNTNDMNLNISAMNTSTSSNKYPHTRAVLTQDAKYDYVNVNNTQNRNQKHSVLNNKIYGRLQQYYNTQNGTTGQTSTNTNQDQTPTTNQNNNATQQTPTTNNQATTSVSEFAQQVINLTNQQRQKNGLQPLQADTTLSSVAQKKALDMQQNNYFSHTSPTYGSPFDMMRDNGVSYKTAGENIAQGQRTPEDVVNAWMNSSGHRANILNKNFTHIGVGFESQGYHWSQMFIGK